MSKVIVSDPGLVLAFRIAWRSEPIPLLFVFVTTNGLATITPVANSEVLLSGTEVAVAVITWPTGTVADRVVEMGPTRNHQS